MKELVDSYLLELHYLPCVEYFSKLAKGEKILLERNENFKKGSYRNRCYIAGANGVQRLSIPLEKGRDTKQSIKDLRVFNKENWQSQHWQSIQSAYGNSPYFEYYAEELKPFYFKKTDFLWDFNWQLLETINEIIGIQPNIEFTEEFQGKAEIPYYNSIKPENNRPKVNADYQPKKYAQVFQEKHGFLPNLSIIDLIFCTGPAALNYLD